LPQFHALGAEVFAVSLTPPARAAAYLQRYPLPFQVAVDPSHAAYHAFGFGRTSWWSILSPTSIARYLRAICRGTWPRKPVEGEDLLQLGGDVVADADGIIRYLYRSRTATDRPPPTELLQAVQGCLEVSQQSMQRAPTHRGLATGEVS
jgi:hypothetical protein